jgi:hypothetical protein
VSVAIGHLPEPDHTYDRVPRLAPTVVAARLAELTGVRLVVDGPCPGGEVGAAYVRWPDGRRGVLTGASPRVALAAVARAAGLPVPRYDLVAEVDGATVAVQERLPGHPPAVVDRALVEAMVVLNGRMAGLLADRPDLPPAELFLTGSGPGFCVHEPLAGYDRRTARLLRWVREVGAARSSADGDDLVHLDFHPGNVLVDAGRITGLVDWDGASRGDRYLDLVTLRFDLALRAPDLTEWFDDLLTDVVPPDRLRAYWAHMSLRLVDWAIRHHTAADVDRWLAVAEVGRRAWD